MKLASSSRYLTNILDTLQSKILPDLQSAAARADAEQVAGVLQELLRREYDYPKALELIIEEGDAIVAEFEGELQKNGVDSHSLVIAETNVSENSGNLIKVFDRLTATITELARAYSQTPTHAQTRLALLRRAAEWECSAHNKLLSLTTKNVADEERLVAEPLPREVFDSYIQSVHPDGGKVQVTAFDRITGGFSKQTWAVTIVDASAQSQQLIVRKCEPIPLSLHKSFDLNREFQLVTEVNRSGFPAPKPLWMANNVAGVDAPFYVMERLPGKPPGSYLGGSGALPKSLLLDIAALLARLHAIPPESLTDFIHRYDTPAVLSETVAQCYRRAVADWRDYAMQAETITSPTQIYMFDWLSENVPHDDSRPVLTHGDYSIHNMLAEDGHVTAILDWEAAGFGAPASDLAYIKPVVEKHMDWQRFVQHYFDCGGRAFDPATLAYYQAFQSMKLLLPMNRAATLFRTGQISDIKFTAFELGFVPLFMKSALDGTAV